MFKKNKNTILSGIQCSVLFYILNLRNFVISQFGIRNIVLVILKKK
jgi:hypothetical protein